MSGMAGFINFDGKPADGGVVESMMSCLLKRGPDGSSVRVNAGSALCHTLFRTVDPHPREIQPISLDGVVWIVADARIDAQADLIRVIRGAGLAASSDMSDAELILAAYAAWGERCVERLLGDFAFAIWDEPKRRLMLARDQMGVKPLFYSRVGHTVVFSNSLDCVRLHPEVSNRLNDQAVADFLLFNFNRDNSTSVYSDICRVPPGHSAVFTPDGVAVGKYWEVPIDEPLYLKRAEDYVGRFLDILNDVISDRLRIPRVSVLMSGGLDSPAIAAAAAAMSPYDPNNPKVKAFTSSDAGYDDEREFATLVAESLRIPIAVQETLQSDADPDWLATRYHTPEPVVYPNFIAGNRRKSALYAEFSRVAFYGEGPDNALRYEWKSHTRELFRRGRVFRLIGDLVNDTIAHGRVPTPRGLATRNLPATHGLPYPAWFDSEFERRANVRERWENALILDSKHPYRPSSHRSFNSSLWQSVFESFDTAETQALVEVRHPLADIRMIKYLLSVPALPWARNKHLIRVAMRGKLPDRVLSRPKAPLLRELWVERVIAQGRPKFAPVAQMNDYVDVGRFMSDPGTTESFWTDFRVPSFNYWLANSLGD